MRNAVPGFTGVITRDELFALAGRDDVSSRLVQKARNRYSLDHGPFRRSALARLPRRNWTLLVDPASGKGELCLHDGAGDSRWYAGGPPVTRPGDCPSERRG